MNLIKKDNLYLPADDDTYAPVARDCVFGCLREVTNIDEGVTLGDIFNFVEKSEDGVLADLIGTLAHNWHMDEFHAQAKEPPSADGEDKLAYLEIYWRPCYYNDRKSLRVEAEFHGVSLENKRTYSVSYTPVNELVHLPVKLNKVVNLEDGSSFYHEYTLLDILDAIYWDISFAGGPEENKAFLEECQDRMEEIADLYHEDLEP